MHKELLEQGERSRKELADFIAKQQDSKEAQVPQGKTTKSD